MSTLMFWNKQNGNATQNGSENGTSNGKNGKKTWLHAPDSLVNGHVAYLVKFLGSTPVDQAKGIDTVKDAIRRLQFSQQIKKAESGSNLKIKKVEITISVDGVAVQEPRGTKILHQFPLHNISYCADEKGVKKFFSFIAKTNASNVPNGGSNGAAAETSGTAEETHECFVFISSKLASDITLTIGQAFELAYRRYMTESGKTPEVSKLQSQNKVLENQLAVYRQRIKDLTEHVPKTELDRILVRNGLRDILDLPQQENGIDVHMANINGSNTPDLGIDVSSPNNDDQLLIETSEKHFAPIVPPRNIQNQISSTLDALKPSVGTKLEGLLLNSDSDSDFDPRADENDTIPNDKHSADSSFFGFEPPKTTMGQQLFATNAVATNGINAMHQNGNGIHSNLTNGVTNNASSPPLLAPPPKASIPRRIGNNTSASQDLFGSTPFDAPLQPSPFDVGSHQIATSLSASPSSSSSSSFHTVNQFNDSALDYSSENVLADLKAFTVNADKLDSVFSSHSSDRVGPKPVPQQTQPQPSNPFLMSPGFGEIPKTTELTTKSMSTMTGKSYNINYDAFRDTFTTNEFSASGVTEVTAPTAQKPAISMDLFRDAAAAAFSEFGTTNGKKHEFFNKMPEFVGQSGKTFNNNNHNNNNINKSLGFSADDFTLESLDPLRK